VLTGTEKVEAYKSLQKYREISSSTARLHNKVTLNYRTLRLKGAADNSAKRAHLSRFCLFLRITFSVRLMITGIHALLYSKNPEADRAFFRDILGFKGVDVGEGWLIFALPPAEMGVHPADEDGETTPELYLLCDDVEKTIEELKAKGIACSLVREFPWGRLTMISLPSGATLGMYQALHEVVAGKL
jgi:predicted enzyme related to lactoylglutathione lyase